MPNPLSAYERGRKKGKKSKLRKALRHELENLTPEDLELIGKIADGQADWAALGKRIGENSQLAAVFKKVGIETEYKEFIDLLVKSGGDIQKYFTDNASASLVKEQKELVKRQIENLTND